MVSPDPTELLRELVSIDSVNPDLVPGGAGEAAIARFAADWLTERGVPAQVQDLGGGRANVLATVAGRGGGRSLMLNAHLDTVGVAGMAQPHVARVQDGRLFGRGAQDTKAGLAAAMTAAVALRDLGLAGDVVVAGVADEEYGSRGTEALLAGVLPDAAIVLEPTELAIVHQHKGYVWVEVVVSGVAAHGSDHVRGVDAIAGAGHVVVELERAGLALLAGPGHPQLGTATQHLSLIAGGQELSSYPDRCVVSLERRTLPGETCESVRRDIVEAVDRAARGAAWTAEVAVTFDRPPLDTPADAAIVAAVAAACDAELGSHRLDVAPAWTDAALLAAAGVSALVFGPVGGGLHERVEWVDLASVADVRDVLVGSATRFCS